VHYQQIYPGVNHLVYYGDQRHLEYDFVVAPGSDPGRIALGIHGGSARVDDQGNMVVATTDGEMSFHKPVVYQVQPEHHEWHLQGAGSGRKRHSPLHDSRFQSER
jgi:hypothetical protein